MILNGSIGWACLNLFIEKGKLGTLPRSVTMRVGMKHPLSLLLSYLETQVIITSLSSSLSLSVNKALKINMMHDGVMISSLLKR